MNGFNGLGVGLHNLARLSAARTRSISAENFDGAKGGGGRAVTGTGADAAAAPGSPATSTSALAYRPRPVAVGVKSAKIR